mgnify:CR=1 FL=1
MNSIFQRPFVRSLGKLILYIWVGWGAVVTAVAVTFIVPLGFAIALIVAASPSATEADTLANLDTVSGPSTSVNELLAVPIEGVIVGSSGEAGLGGSLGNSATSGYDVKKMLYDAAGHDEIKGVVLEINSPGGTIYGAHAIADGVAHYREQTKRPVYAHVSGVGASGAYWAAVSTDKVLADYGSDVGSIGVVLGPFKYYNTVLSEDGGLLAGGVMTQGGIESVEITAGRSKDVGNPYRRLTADEQRLFQQSVNNEYDNFVQYVSQRRSIPDATIRSQIGAMIYDNKSAQSLKLIDATASRDEAYTQLAKAAGVGDDFRVTRPAGAQGLLTALLGVVGLTPPKHVATPLDTCSLTRTTLSYYGSVADLCQK